MIVPVILSAAKDDKGSKGRPFVAQGWRARMHIVHLTASTFFGGPERQMLGLAEALAPDCRTTFLSFAEGGRCRAFLGQAAAHGFAALALENDTPRLRAAARELTDRLRGMRPDVLLCHGYKPNLLGRVAARRARVPAVAVSRGWTGENVKVRLYEALDRLHLRFMDRVVCVSEGQAAKVRRTGVPPERVAVIRNAARLQAFRSPDPAYRERLRALTGGGESPPARVVCAAGRLSPEKGFHVLVDAAGVVADADPAARFVLFGEGAQRPLLERRIAGLGLQQRFVLAGFRPDLDRFLPWADVMVLPSFTEGLPNVALEASAAAVPVVATAVGGNPEVVRDGETGHLVPPGDPHALAGRILDLLRDEPRRRRMGAAARALMEAEFTFAAQARAYRRLFGEVLARDGFAASRA